MRRLFRLALLPAIIAAGGAAFADQKCALTLNTSLDMSTDPTGGVYISALVNGHSEHLLVDTGGVASMLTSSTVKELGLQQEPVSRRVIMSMLGARIAELVHADTVQLGNMRANNIVFLVMPDSRVSGEENGTLAPDFMDNYDVEFDFANGKFNLFSPQHCPGQAVYWTHQAYTEIPFEIEDLGHIVTTVNLDGKSVDAVIDTGSSQSIMGYEAARDLFGWNDKTAGLAVASKRADGTPATYRFPFKVLSMSGVAVNNPDILLFRQLASDDVRIGSPKMLFILGLDVLRQLHLYISYKEKTIYATPAEAH